MRRAVSSITVAFGLLTATIGCAGVAVAAPAPTASDAAPPAGKKRCTVTDERLRELSGLVATKSGYIVVNDSTDIDSHKRVFYLDTRCEVTKSVRYSGQGPLDPEDLALSPDGKTLWIADIGDNITSTNRRERVALWTMPVDGSEEPQLHRVAYPERKPHDAEALLITDDNKPLIVTKTLSGKAQIFAPTGALKTNNAEPVPMEQVGEVALPKTTTPNVLQGPGRVAITGAARSPDGSRVVLRTYADAFEYDVTGGDVLAALTKGEPRVTPLADPFGEAISYTPDGKLFVTVSDAGELGEDEPIDILAYTPSSKGAEPVADDPKKKASSGGSWTDGLSLNDLTYLIAAVGVLGALLVGAGIFGIVRARRRPERPTKDDPSGTGDLPDRDAVDRRPGGAPHDPPGRDRPRGGGVYGAPPPGDVPPTGRPAGGNVYGGGPPPSGGGVYGGSPGGGVYGGGAPSGGRSGYRGGRSGGPGPSGGRGGYGDAPAGGGGVYGGSPGGGVYGGGTPSGGGGYRGGPPGGGAPGGGASGGGGYGGRAEPPRRGRATGRRDEPEHRGRRGGYDPEGYGRATDRDRDYRGTRY
ncbi:hypothetical protein [Micromonospora cathayae]|uniref:Uncharacterized protein n=1 Tax=Micromonospora cathayae TaxID=3028804 RepID=A0ABY7ZX03_9ACTN|nr:hypothetical protein [Micromonospora sp. HUAS 3]WDZ87589.1 hypothetical protein PVK37_14850 [Micromonospora sp. HUAS 3]